MESLGANSRCQFTVHISSDQETTNIPKAMVLQRKNISLLALLESHTGGTTLEVAINPHPPTPFPSRVSLAEALEKKRKKDKKARKDMSEEGEIQPTKDQEPSKGVKAIKG